MTDPRDDVGRWTEALRAASEDSGPRDDCPAAERIWDAVRVALPLAERQAIVEHTIACPACAEAWRLALELGSQQGGTGVATPPRSERRWRPGLRSWAAAAVLVLGLGTMVFVHLARDPSPLTLRESSGGAIRSLVREGPLPRADCALRWSAGVPGARYDLTVTTVDLEVLVMVRGLERSEYRVPSERLADLPPGAHVLWRVVARAPDGSETASPTYDTALD